jgi:hypothetical protein
MKRFAAAYTVRENNRQTKVKVFWTRAEDAQIARDNFSHFVNEQCKREVINIYPMHYMG